MLLPSLGTPNELLAVFISENCKMPENTETNEVTVSRIRFLTRRVNKRTDRNGSERCKAERIPLYFFSLYLKMLYWSRGYKTSD
jgi:hypothetical protein